MSFLQKGSLRNADTSLDTLTVENDPLDQSNMPELSNTDFQTLTELSQEITFTTSEMETEEQEVVVESQEVMEHEEEIEAEDISPEESNNYSHQSNNYPEQLLQCQTNKTTSVPPLRPLTIAPKPAKVPIAVKSASGQQLLLLQGTSPGQSIKLVSSQGQELNLANIISRPMSFKPTFKTISSQGGNISIVHQKPVVMKKILAAGQKTITKPLTTFAKQGQHYMVVQKSDQPLKLVQTQGGGNIGMSSPTKTLTLQQAQDMGLLTNTKIIQQGQTTPKQTVLLSKNPQKSIKLIPQVSAAQLVTVGSNTKTIALSTVKGPTKILPANNLATNKVSQKFIFKTSGSNQSVLPQGQIIQVAGSQALNTGQLHQINIPGRGMQYIKFVTTNPTESNTVTTTTGNSIIRTAAATSVGNIVLSEVKTVSGVNKIAPKPIPGKVAIPPQRPLSNTTPMMIIPTDVSQMAKVDFLSTSAKSTPVLKPPSVSSESSSPITPKEEVDADGMRPRKPCNCNKSQCLKLYCDCFANGEFCYMCKCLNCFNNLENEEHRSRAIKACLERNPNAFRPKIGKTKDTAGDQAIRKHTKGCNCKRSGCLKNYCECYEAKIACSNNCKCVGCRNIEDSIEKKNMRHMTTEKATNTPVLPDGEILSNKDYAQIRPRRSSGARKQTINFITDDVIEATCQCLLTISDNAEENMQDEEMTKRLIIEEFGRCLTEIIDCSSTRNLC